jgi:hypothetical protein
MFSNTDWIETLSTIGFQSKTHLVQKMNDDTTTGPFSLHQFYLLVYLGPIKSPTITGFYRLFLFIF